MPPQSWPLPSFSRKIHSLIWKGQLMRWHRVEWWGEWQLVAEGDLHAWFPPRWLPWAEELSSPLPTPPMWTAQIQALEPTFSGLTLWPTYPDFRKPAQPCSISWLWASSSPRLPPAPHSFPGPPWAWGCPPRLWGHLLAADPHSMCLVWFNVLSGGWGSRELRHSVNPYCKSETARTPSKMG